MSKLYYTPPTDEQFEECKKVCMELWPKVNSDNDKYGYATSKINQIKDIKNIQDNFMYMVAMFDHINQGKLASMLSAEAREVIRERMIDGGQPQDSIIF